MTDELSPRKKFPRQPFFRRRKNPNEFFADVGDCFQIGPGPIRMKTTPSATSEGQFQTTPQRIGGFMTLCDEQRGPTLLRTFVLEKSVNAEFDPYAQAIDLSVNQELDRSFSFVLTKEREFPSRKKTHQAEDSSRKNSSWRSRSRKVLVPGRPFRGTERPTEAKAGSPRPCSAIIFTHDLPMVSRQIHVLILLRCV